MVYVCVYTILLLFNIRIWYMYLYIVWVKHNNVYGIYVHVYTVFVKICLWYNVYYTVRVKHTYMVYTHVHSLG